MQNMLLSQPKPETEYTKYLTDPRYQTESVYYTHPGAHDIYPKLAAYLGVCRDKVRGYCEIYDQWAGTSSLLYLPGEDTLAPGEIFAPGTPRGDFAKMSIEDRKLTVNVWIEREELMSKSLTMMMTHYFKKG